jgi:NAD(P)H-dependent nitrite reductase small subunit
MTQTIEWHRVASTEDFRNSEAKAVTLSGRAIGLFRAADGYYAIDDICTHEFALLSDGFVEGCEVECPLHMARFDLRTGKAMSPPADQDVATFPVRVEGTDIYVGLAKG